MIDCNGAAGGRRPAPPSSHAGRHGRWSTLATLLAAGALGLLLRCLEFHSVFPAEGEVRLGVDDSYLHARRALFSLVNFPAVLEFDAFLAWPDGAAAPVPPLFDWLTAGIARIFGDERRTLEVVAAWVSPVLGALLVWPAYAIGRSVASRSVGLLAAWLAALLPSGILMTRLGNFDHHGAVALLAACWLAVSVASVGHSTRDVAIRTAVMASVVALMLFTWSGSLLYVGVGVAAQLTASVALHGRRVPLVSVGASLLGAAAPAMVWLALSATPLGGTFSSQTLSWLHVVVLLGLASLAFLLAVWERRRPGAGPAFGLARLALGACVIGLPLLALPQLREPIVAGIGFLGQQDAWARGNPEQLSLFHAATTAAPATLRLGFLAYGVPLLPLYLGWRAARSPDPETLVVLSVWVTALTLLLLSQVRYGTDFTVPGSVAFALLAMDVRRSLARKLSARAAGAVVAAAGVIALLPCVTQLHLPSAARALSRLQSTPDPAQEAWRTPHQIAAGFARRVRNATPRSAGYVAPGARPEYGILVPPHMGHRFAYLTQRSVPANNLGPYLDAEKYRLAKTFYRSRHADEALETLAALGVRYVVTEEPERVPATFADFLHVRNDSTLEGRATTGRLRLIVSSQVVKATTPTREGRQRARLELPLKLFEIVPGAVLIVEAAAGSEVSARIRIVPRNGGATLYRTLARAGPDGLARLRVPYPTRQRGSVTTPGPWWIRVGDREVAVEVDEADVRGGRELRVSGASAGRDPVSGASAGRGPVSGAGAERGRR